MATTAKLFRNGRSQAVRLPREFRFEGDRVRVRRAGRAVVVERDESALDGLDHGLGAVLHAEFRQDMRVLQ